MNGLLFQRKAAECVASFLREYCTAGDSSREASEQKIEGEGLGFPIVLLLLTVYGQSL